MMTDLPDTKYARTDDGLALAYQTLGPGGDDVLFIPNIFSVDLLWDEPQLAAFLRRLSRLGRLVTLDFRGHGASDPVPLGALPSPEIWMEDTRVVLDAVGSTGAHVVCHGATFLGLLFAATYPDRTRSLTLIDATARPRESVDYPCGIPDDVIEQFLEWDAQTYGTAEHLVLFAPSRAEDEAFARWLGRYERTSNSPSVHAALTRWLTALDMRAVLSAIHVPTLVIGRENSAIAPPGQARYVADHISGARYVELPGRDYWFFTEHLDLLHDHIFEFLTGAKPLVGADRALTTVMFTDIVGSTELAARLGDRRWTDILDRHDLIVDRQLERHRGRKVNPTGDGLLATFDGPARAVRCALAVCEEVRSLGIDVRAGVHTGEVELRGNDIGGIAVHIGQRISSLASAGEVFASRTVTDLVAGSGLVFHDRGERELKGVPGRWQIFEAAPETPS